MMKLLVWILSCMVWSPAWAQGTSLPEARDLAVDARIMRDKRIPMLVLFSRADCAWCERARREFLVPLQKDPATAARVTLRQIDIDRDTPLTDFSGLATSHRALARAHNATFTPTLMFFGPGGEQLSEAIVGFRLPDFYGAFIDRGIEQSLSTLRPPPR